MLSKQLIWATFGAIFFLYALCGVVAGHLQPALDEVAPVVALPIGLAFQGTNCVYILFNDNVQHSCLSLTTLQIVVSKQDLGEFDITHGADTTDVGGNLFLILRSKITSKGAIAYVNYPNPLQIVLDYEPLASSPPSPSDLCLVKFGDTDRVAMLMAKNTTGSYLLSFNNNLQAFDVLGSFPLPSESLPASPYFVDMPAGVAFRFANSSDDGATHLVSAWFYSKSTGLLESFHSVIDTIGVDFIGPVRTSLNSVRIGRINQLSDSIQGVQFDADTSSVSILNTGSIGFSEMGHFSIRGCSGSMVMLSTSNSGTRAVTIVDLGGSITTIPFDTTEISFPQSAGGVSYTNPIFIVASNGSVWLVDPISATLRRQDGAKPAHKLHFSALGILFTTTTTPSSAVIGISNSTSFKTAITLYESLHELASCANDPSFRPGPVTGIVGLYSELLSTASELVFAYAVSYSDAIRLEYSKISYLTFTVISSIDLYPKLRTINDVNFPSAGNPVSLQQDFAVFSHVPNGLILGAKTVAAEDTVLIAANFEDESTTTLTMLRNDPGSLACVESFAVPIHYASKPGATMALSFGDSSLQYLFWFNSVAPHERLTNPSMLPNWNSSFVPVGQQDIPIAFGINAADNYILGAGLFQGAWVGFIMRQSIPNLLVSYNLGSQVKATMPVRSAVVETVPGSPHLFFTTIESDRYFNVHEIYYDTNVAKLNNIFVNATGTVPPRLIPLQNGSVMAITLSPTELGFSSIITTGLAWDRYESPDMYFIDVIMTKPLVPGPTAEPFFLLAHVDGTYFSSVTVYWCSKITSCTDLALMASDPTVTKTFLLASEMVAIISFYDSVASLQFIYSVSYNSSSGQILGPYSASGPIFSVHQVSPSLAMLVDQTSIKPINLVTGSIGNVFWTIPDPSLRIVSSTMVTLPSGAKQFVFEVSSPYKGNSLYRTTEAFCDATCGAAACLNHICVDAPAAPPMSTGISPTTVLVPTPVVVSCGAVPPLPEAVCVAGTWVVQGNVTLNTTANITAPITINGSLIMTNGSVVYVSSQANITVQGCVSLGGSLTATHPAPAQSINETITLLLFSEGYCNSNDTTFGSVELFVEGAQDCAESTYSPNYQPTSFSLLFSYDNSGCSKNDNNASLTVGAIIGIVIAAVAVVGIAIAVTVVVRLRKVVHPFHEHEGNAEKRHSTL